MTADVGLLFVCASMERCPILHSCLYFTANALAREVTRLADDSFAATGLSPSHAFLVMVACNQPGIGPSELGQGLHLAPSTITRFVEHLENKGYLRRESHGRQVSVFPTPAGEALVPQLQAAWANLHDRYQAVLGDSGHELAVAIDSAHRDLTDPALATAKAGTRNATPG